MAGRPAAEPAISRVAAIKVFVAEAPIDITVLDPEGRVVAVSPVSAANRGLTTEQMNGRLIDQIFPGVQEAVDAAWERIRDGALSNVAVERLPMPDGDVRWIQVLTTPWRDDDGQLAGVMCISADITAQHNAQLEQKRSEALLNAVIRNFPGSVMVQDLESRRYLLANPTVAQHLGLPPEEIIGHDVRHLLDPETIAAIDQHVRAAERSDGAYVTEERIPTPDGVKHLQVKRVVFEDAANSKRLLTIAEDISERHRAAEALKAAVTEAEAANNAKSQFLANISHEIRTPLNGVLGMAQAMVREPLSEEQRARLDVIRQSGEALLGILNDVLDLSKIEAGKFELEAIDFDLAEVLAGVHATFVAVAEQKGLSLEADIGDAGGVYRGDPARLRQVLANLVSNALKFTETGGARITAQRVGAGLRLTVQDTGIGMPPEVVGKLFGKFVQADASTTRRYGGTGLGLAICRELVERMGGAVVASSELGRGSKLTLTVPLLRVGAARGRHAPAADTATSSVVALRVLAAEDNAVNRLVLQTLMGQFGVEVVIVENGALAVEAWAREAFDLILMDVQMPVMDGPTASRLIRARERAEGRRRTPIIALTANALNHQRDDYIDAGMDEVVPKPLELEVLIRTMNAVLEQEDPMARRAARA